jgi:hypothetical protein
VADSLNLLGSRQLSSSEIPPASFATLTGAGATGLLIGEPVGTEPRELRILDDRVTEAGIALFRRSKPELAQKLDGAIFALKGGNPDATSQAANSLQELIDQTLRTLIDEATALAWCRQNCPSQGVYVKGGREALTRAGRVRYIAGRAGVSDTIAEGIATLVGVASQLLQQAKHSHSNEAVIRNLVLVVEGSMGAVLSMRLQENKSST